MGAYTKYGTCPICNGKTMKHDADFMWTCMEPGCPWSEDYKEGDDNHEDETMCEDGYLVVPEDFPYFVRKIPEDIRVKMSVHQIRYFFELDKSLKKEITELKETVCELATKGIRKHGHNDTCEKSLLEQEPDDYEPGCTCGHDDFDEALSNPTVIRVVEESNVLERESNNE